MCGWLSTLALFCFSSACLSQQVYKWKDGAGTIHYSEQPPPNGVKKVRMKLSVNDAGENISESDATPTSKPDDQTALDKANDKQERHLCSTARQNMKLLDSGAMIASGGDIKVATQLAGEQREKARGEAQAQVERYCHGQ